MFLHYLSFQTLCGRLQYPFWTPELLYFGGASNLKKIRQGAAFDIEGPSCLCASSTLVNCNIQIVRLVGDAMLEGSPAHLIDACVTH